jgi:II/X family phage/plasmid replication protein
MLIDWITARLPDAYLPPEQWRALQAIGDRIVRFTPSTGEVVYESSAWDSVRSDSHSLAFRVGSDALWMQGSPARVLGDGCTVFGSAASVKLDLVACVEAMRCYIAKQINVILPPAQSWVVTRIDVTGNILLGSLSEVRDALAILRNCEGGRYRVSQQAGDTVYWSHHSRHRKAKAYAKGPHLRYQMQQKQYTGRQYTAREVRAADRLLRLELTLGSKWLKRHAEHWTDISGQQLAREWEEYFSRMIGDQTMTNDNEVKEAIQAVSESEGRGRAAYGCWLMIKAEGWERARESFSKSSWYRHLQLLHAAGLGDADIASGRVVPIRRRILDARLVNEWSEILAA